MNLKFTFLFLFLFPLTLLAQESEGNTVRIHEDPRIPLIVNKPPPRNTSGKMSGFRIQIYNGNDRNKANEIKLNFLRSYPNTRAYLTYHKPQFRVRVGDFRSRRAASEFAKGLGGRFTNMIVPERINAH